MTVEIVDKIKTSIKRKEHPNAKKYPGRPSMEHGTALRSFMDDLELDEYKQFTEGTLVFEEAATAEFYDSIQEGDVVGLGLFKGLIDELNTRGAPAAYQFKVLKINENDTMDLRNVTWEVEKKDKDGNSLGVENPGQETTLAFEDFSYALGMGFGEILERDGKPFGVPEEQDLEILIYGETDTEVSGSQEDESSAEADESSDNK